MVAKLSAGRLKPPVDTSWRRLLAGVSPRARLINPKFRAMFLTSRN
jgi:hypothetical protein